MGIWEDLFSKHGHKKDKTTQEFLQIIKQMSEQALIAEQNERRLLKEIEQLQRWLYRCQHPPKKSVTFDVVFS